MLKQTFHEHNYSPTGQSRRLGTLGVPKDKLAIRQVVAEPPARTPVVCPFSGK